ncbi:hypothetical protein Tco_1088673 [Tanacetum coccineum]
MFEAANTELPHNQGGDLGNTDDQANVEADSRHEWFKKPKRPPTPDSDWNAKNSIDFRPPQTKISIIAQAEKPPRPAYNHLKGTCKSFVELEYHFEECYKAVTDQLDWHNPEG